MHIDMPCILICMEAHFFGNCKKHANFELLPVGRVTLKEIDASDFNAAIRTKFRECYDVEKVKLIDFHRNLQIF